MSLAGKGKTTSIRGGDDPFDRYQMPVLEVRFKNKGQYSETIIGGLKAVAKSLKVPEECLIKHFSFNLKTRTGKVEAGLLLKGQFSQETVEASLREFIDAHVLCGQCGLPELIYRKNNTALQSKCLACGHAVRENMTNRMWKVFHKSIPKQKPKQKLKPKPKQTLPPPLPSTEIEWMTDVSDEAVQKRKTEQLGSTLLEELVQD